MAPVTNGRVLFNSIPENFPVPGQTTVYDESETIDLEDVPLNGGVLIKTLDLSIDPYLRGKMRDPSIKSYSPPFEIGKPLYGGGIGVILLHQQYFVLEQLSGLIIIQNPHKLAWSTFTGVLGMPGLTAFAGWREFAQAKKGETGVRDNWCGPSRILAWSFNSQLDGLKVIASAGSDEKVEFIKELGADVAFNYKTTSTENVLQKEGPLDIFWDNVGGDILDAALIAANTRARFIECGMISGYNTGHNGIKNIFQIVSKALSVLGNLVGLLASKYIEEFRLFTEPKVASGAIKHREDITQGLAKVGDAILAV
ncbi:alcohol dehydrogenase [Crepidotus variabilis]|uniref:Alcohol dehydrogenase n=1 Tax=Crepidotus variabilis TaxID=179855 RepID=A0A9P6E6G3_9AGAR|nr:alcohol dehydrogenase [Crepidotus variabilis]